MQNLSFRMCSTDSSNKSHVKKIVDFDVVDESSGDVVGGNSSGKRKSDSKITISKGHNSSENSDPSILNTSRNFSRILDGVIFALSGFVNPERSMLRSWAMEMGAEYQPEWNSNCTLLICAFPNTPKFRQVEADCGTIVSKEWITECYTQKKLTDIDSYIMHAGKPWRKYILSPQIVSDPVMCSPGKPKTHTQGSHEKPVASALLKVGASSSTVEYFPSSDLKKWAVNDFDRIIKWLDNLEVKPEPSEIKKVGVEGILTCLQDAIESLEKKQDMKEMAEAWLFIPRVVEELAKLYEKANGGSAVVSKEDVVKEAKACVDVYERELRRLMEDNDSDDTIEMSDSEIEAAYNSVAASNKLC